MNNKAKHFQHKIDWEEQWKLHGANFYEGFVHLDLTTEDPNQKALIRLQPGPGFGDLSHPTTLLMLKRMPSLVKGKHVLDVGCGSGVLSLAAVAMEAASVHGIDIDPEAIIHSQANSKINGMEDRVSFGLAAEYRPPKNIKALLILMNMIQSEQKIAWNGLSSVHHLIRECLTSGILYEERLVYLNQCEQFGWKLQEEKREKQWMSFYFSRDA